MTLTDTQFLPLCKLYFCSGTHWCLTVDLNTSLSHQRHVSYTLLHHHLQVPNWAPQCWLHKLPCEFGISQTPSAGTTISAGKEAGFGGNARPLREGVGQVQPVQQASSGLQEAASLLLSPSRYPWSFFGPPPWMKWEHHVLWKYSIPARNQWKSDNKQIWFKYEKVMNTVLVTVKNTIHAEIIP